MRGDSDAPSARGGSHQKRLRGAAAADQCGRARTILSKNFGKLYNPDVNNFFSHRTTITVGGTVSFHVNGFHTVDLAPKGKGDLPLIVPSGWHGERHDAAGNPFWFNGKAAQSRPQPGPVRPQRGLTSTTAAPASTAGSAPRSRSTSSSPSPASTSSTATSTRGWSATSSSRRRARRSRRPAQNTASITEPDHVRHQGRQDAGEGQDPQGHRLPRRGASDGVELYTMFPNTLKVKANTTVTFAMSPFTRETHTATFGPPSYLGRWSRASRARHSRRRGVYPSSPASIVLTPTSHGNGFANTGALDRDPSTPAAAFEHDRLHDTWYVSLPVSDPSVHARDDRRPVAQ